MNQFGGQVKSKQESFFVDREESLGRLNDAENDMIYGNEKVVFLKGERGIGKTKIAEKFIEKCEREGFKVFQGRFLYYETSEQYIPFYDALEGHFDQQQVNEEKEQTSNLGLMAQRGLSSSEKEETILVL